LRFFLSNLFTKKLNITWDDILGADGAKAVLKESVMLPLEFPELFSELNPTWRGLLVHGAPGVGKTMLAKALCSETNGKISFFNITPSSMISKWRGESEKMLRVGARVTVRGLWLINFFSDFVRNCPTECPVRHFY
jgi:katanin p60 ATPase-containing subunit A1